MGEFFEPEPIEPLAEKPKIFTNEFISTVVNKSLANGDMPPDHKLAFVAIVDENGIGAILSVQVLDKPIGDSKLNVKIQSAVEHTWTGDNKAGAKLLFSIK